jgi:hypothetical protein
MHGGNNDLNGAVGVTTAVNNHVTLGGGIIGDHGDFETPLMPSRQRPPV